MPLQETFLVSSQVGCAQVLLETDSCCAHTKYFDLACRRSVVHGQDFWFKVSFRSFMVQNSSFRSEPARCNKFTKLEFDAFFDVGSGQAPRYGGALVIKNTRSLRPFRFTSLCSIVTGSVRGLRTQVGCTQTSTGTDCIL